MSIFEITSNLLTNTPGTSEQGRASSTLNPNRGDMEKRMRDTASDVFTEFRLEGKLCDVVIKVGDVEFDAHKIILCSCSPYFCTLFTGAWATSKKQMYIIPGVTPEMMQLIINYAYTHSIPVTKHNVAEVLAAGDQFWVQGIIQACCCFLEDQLCLRNCIGIWRLVSFYHCPELKQKVFFYILHNFEDIVCVSNELLNLSLEQLVVIIENDHLNVQHENTVFEAIQRWINHVPDQRRGCISVLLPKVRLGLMSPAYLEYAVIENALVKDQAECKPIIEEAIKRFRSRNSTRGHPLVRPRLPPAILLITGGKDFSTATTSLKAYDARADLWVTLNAKTARAHHGAAVLNGFVYVIGGCNLQTYLNSVQRFDIVTCTWHQVAPMNFCRCYVSVAVQNGCIYAMGGFNGHTYYNTVECYNPERNQWTMMAPMRAKRCGAGATTLNGKVYICGGFNGYRSLSTAECYNPNTNLWTPIAPMRRCRSGLGVTAYRGEIYAVGGTVSGYSHLRTVEVYNPQTCRWSTLIPMSNPRSYFGIGVVDDQLFVVGGQDCSTTLSAVECYSEITHMWHNASYIGMSRSGLSCCVLQGHHSVVENLFPRDDPTIPSMEEARS